MSAELLIVASQFALLVAMYLVNRRVELAHKRLDLIWSYARSIDRTNQLAIVAAAVAEGGLSEASADEILDRLAAERREEPLN